MPHLESVTLNSASVDPAIQTYIYTATSTNSTFTYTLPLITCDGMRYKFNREDNDATSTLTIASNVSNSILYKGSSLSSLSVGISTNIVFISKDSVWSVIEFADSTVTSGGSIISGAFVANNGSPFQLFSGSQSNTLVSTFYHPGSAFYTINYLYCAIRIINGPFSVSITLTRPNNTVVTATTSISLSTTIYPIIYKRIPSEIFNALISPTPTYLNLLLTVSGAGGNGRVEFYSFVLR